MIKAAKLKPLVFTLYMEMLEQAVKALREGKQPALDQLLQAQTEIDLRVPALLPESYIADVNTRLSLYKRIASSDNTQALHEIQVELIDRFGLLPDAVKNLVRVAELRSRAQQLGIRKIDGGPNGVNVEFATDTKVSPQVLIQLIQQQPNEYRLEGPTRLRILRKIDDTQARLKLVESLLDEFARG